MPDEIDRNQIDSEGRGRSMNKGDVPEPLRRRYYLDERGGPGLGFYADARIKTAAFRDLGARLVSPRSDPNAIRDMASVAQHRGWSVVIVHGEADFRREAWLTMRALGMEVRGYQPNERDRQELAADRRLWREKPPARQMGGRSKKTATLSIVQQRGAATCVLLRPSCARASVIGPRRIASSRPRVSDSRPGSSKAHGYDRSTWLGRRSSRNPVVLGSGNAAASSADFSARFNVWMVRARDPLGGPQRPRYERLWPGPTPRRTKRSAKQPLSFPRSMRRP